MVKVEGASQHCRGQASMIIEYVRQNQYLHGITDIEPLIGTKVFDVSSVMATIQITKMVDHTI